MRIALFTPLLPVRTALADIIEGYLPHLAQFADLTVVTTGDYDPSSPLFSPRSNPHIPVISFQQFREQASSFDLFVYNLGDEPNIHGYMLDALHEYPGVVLLHDLVLHHAIFQRTWAQGKLDAYTSELAYSYGQEAAERIVEGVQAGQYEALATQYPLVERVLDSSVAAVGFNHHLVERVRALCPDLPLLALPYPFYLPRSAPDASTIQRLRDNMGGANKVIIGTFGLFNSQKRLDITLRAFKRLQAVYPQARCALIGAALEKELERRLNELQLLENVATTGWLSPADFSDHMYAVDIAVQLRYPHVGGTPYTPIRLLGLGVPTIISDIEPQAEIPQDAVLRVVPKVGNEEDSLLAALDCLVKDPAQANQMGNAGKRYVQEHHDPAAAALEFGEFLRETLAQLPELKARVACRSRGTSQQHPSSNPVHLVGKALAEMGVHSTDTELLRAVAGAIYDISLPLSPGE